MLEQQEDFVNEDAPVVARGKCVASASPTSNGYASGELLKDFTAVVASDLDKYLF